MPQVVAAAALWVGNTVLSVTGAVLTATGFTAATSAATAYGVASGVASLAYAVSEIALWAGMSYAVDAATKPKLKPPGSELQFNMDPAYPREMIIGQRLVGGSMVARYSRGSNLYNAHMVIQLADHPCVELSKVYDAGRVVRDTPLTHGTRTEITSYSNSGGARVWMTWWDGRPGQTADTDLITKSAQDPDVVAGKLPGWTSNHVGAGCAYVHVEVQWDSDILTSIPQFTWLVKGAKLYDRRLDTTAGGSGSHRLNDPSTWAYSTNAAVAAGHYLLGYKVEDDDLAFGIGLHPSEVPYAIFANAADLADEDVVTGTGDDAETIKRYVVNGVVSTAEYFEDVLESFQLQMAARFVDLGGRIGILGAEERDISLDLSDQDLTSDDQMQFSDKLSFDDLYGSVSGTFADPANLYQQTPYDTLETAYNALPDGGEAQQVQLALPYEIHPRRAVRLASAWLSRESLQPRLVGVFMAVAWALEPGDWFTFSSERLQLTEAKFEVIDIAKNDDFTVTITARAIDPDFLAFSVDNDPDLSVPPEVEPVDLILDTPVFTPTATTISGGGATEPVIQVVVTAPNPVTRELVIEAQEWNGSALTGPVLFFVGHADNLTSILRQGLKPNTAYKVRMKARAGARESAWSEWSSAITTTSTYVVPTAGTATGASGDLADTIDDLEAADAALDSAIDAANDRIDDAEADLAAGDAAIQAAVDAAEARLDDAEDTLGLQGTDIGALETVTANQATLITGLQAKTTINANLLPNSTGAGGLEGWTNPGAWQVYDHPLWGPWFNRLFTGASTFTEYFFNADEIPVNASTQYTVSFAPFLSGLDGGSVVFYVVYYNSGGTYVGEGGNLVLTADSTSGARYTATFTTGATTAKVRFAVAMVNAVGDATYAHIGFWQAKIERGATATVWSDDGTLQEARARITTVESVNSDQDSAIATLDSRLDAAETDIDGVTGDVLTLEAANLITRMAAVDGGSASAQTLSAVKAELEGDIAGEASTRSAAVTSLESADADHDSAIASLDTRLDAAETDVDGLESTASNHTSRLAAIDGGSASAQTLSAIKAELEGDIAGEASTRAAAITSVESVNATQDGAIAALDSRLDAAETDIDSVTGDVATLEAANLISRMAAVDGGSASAQTLSAVKAELESDIAGEASTRSAAVTSLESADADHDSAIATLDSRLDAAETDIDGVQSTASNLSTRMAAVDGGSAVSQTLSQVKAELVAKTNPGQNLMPYPSGLGNNALASTVGWASIDVPTPTQALYMPFNPAAGGAFYYTYWSSGYTSAGPAFYTFEIPANPGTFTVSMEGVTNLTGAVFYVQAYNGGSYLAESSTVSVSATRSAATVVAPSGTTRLLVAILIPAQNSAGAYRELRLQNIKVELGSTMTSFSDDYGAGNVRARVTETEEAIADEVSARAAAITSVEADIGDVEADVTVIQSALASPDGATALIAMEANAAGVVTGFKIISSNGHSTPISLIEFTAALATFDGDVIVAGSITTDRIETDGISEMNVVTTTASIDFSSLPDATWVDFITAAGVVVPADTKVVIDFSFITSWALTSGAGEIQLRLRRDSTTIESWTDISTLDVDSPGVRQTVPFASSETDLPGAGTYTYKLQVKMDELGSIDPAGSIREGKFKIAQFYR